MSRAKAPGAYSLRLRGGPAMTLMPAWVTTKLAPLPQTSALAGAKRGANMPGTLKSLYGSLSWPDVAARDRVEQIRRTFADPRAAEFELIREQAARPNGLGVALTALQQQELERSNLRWRLIGYGCGGRMSEEFAELRAKFEWQRVAAEESMRELQSQGYAWEPPQPERQHCACGQELRPWKGRDRAFVYGLSDTCGDCRQQFARGQQGITASPSLDARIAAAKSSDPDPTSEWGAGATPGYDWEGR